ncbi:MAG TPA: hypothetical protein VIM55_16460 [Mucilaginibacter sp.]
MKNLLIITALACSICAMSACSGDRTPRNGKGDTVDSNYGKMGGDSSATDTTKGTGLDNSGSGGTKIDSAKKDSAKK